MAKQPFGGTGKPQPKGQVNNPVKYTAGAKKMRNRDTNEVAKGRTMKKGKC